MEYPKHFPRAIILFLLIASLFACRKPVSWNTELAVPLTKGTLNVHDMLPDSVRESRNKGHVFLVLSQNLYTLDLTRDYIAIPDTILRQNVSLDSLKIPNRSMYYPITLGAIARADNSTTGALIIALNGNTAPIPSFGNLSATDLPVDATELFQTADVRSGWMDLEIKNGLPIPVSNLVFQMKNASDGTVIISDQVASIEAGETFVRSYDLSGKILEGHILVDIVNIGSPGSNNQPVPIDTSDALELRMTVRDMELNAAEAVFPAQNLVNIAKEIVYNMNGPEFTYLAIRSGFLIITAFNTIEDSLYINYRIPNARNPDGIILDENSVVPPGHADQAAKVDERVPLDGYSIDLTGANQNRVNTFYNELRVRIDSTGKLIYISLADSVSILYGLVDIVPEYVEGYLGTHHIAYSAANQELRFFRFFDGGRVNFEDVKMQIRIRNEIGADSRLLINALKTRSADGREIQLQAPFIGVPQNLERAFKNPLRAGESIFSLTPSNSNIKEMMESLPRYLDLDLDLDINPEGNRLHYQDFASYDSKVRVNMELEMPLSLTSNNLVMANSFAFTFPKNQEANDIQSLEISGLIKNTFPLSSTVQIYVYQNGILLDSLFAVRPLIKAANVDKSDCRTAIAATSEISAPISEEAFDHLKMADELRFKAWVNTTESPAACGDYIKIFDDYNIDIALGLNIHYLIGNE